MKVLVVGANSYIGTRLIPVLLEKGHQVVCLSRDKKYFSSQNYDERVTVLNGDLLRSKSIESFPGDIDAAYYLVNRLTQTLGFAGMEALSAQNFMDALSKINCRQVITVSTIFNTLSASTLSRLNVEDILGSGKAALTIFQTNMIIGTGSIAMELFKALTKNTPIFIAKTWAQAFTQPIYCGDVLEYLEGSLLNQKTFNQCFDICGPEILSFKQMLLTYIAIFKDFKPSIITLPFLTTKLSSNLLNLLATTSYTDAQTLFENLKTDKICLDNSISDIIPRQCLTFKQSLRTAIVFS